MKKRIMGFVLVLMTGTGCLPGRLDLPISDNSSEHSAEVVVCQVSPNYLEALEENTGSLLSIQAMVNTTGSVLEAPEALGLQYTLLASIRRYHEGEAETLPECAKAINTATLRTIAASQDVLALRMARVLNPGASRYATRLESAMDHLNAQWASQAEAKRGVGLIPED